MKRFLAILALLVTCAIPTFLPVWAAGNVYQEKQEYDFYDAVRVRGALAANSTLAVTGATTLGSTAAITGNTTVGGTLGVTGAVSLTTPLTAANIQTGSAKRTLTHILLSPVTGAAADSTTYAGIFAPNRAGTITRIGFVAAVPPVGGTDTLEALKNNTTTQLNAATLDATTLVAYTTTNATLTATGADLAMAATDVTRLKYNQGSASTDAQAVEAVVEYEMTNF